MKPLVRTILAVTAVAACLAAALAGDRVSAGNRRETTCKGVDAIVADSALRSFVSPDDIRGWMEEYGTYVGLRLDSVDLCRVEALIDGKSAVRKSQAWLTDDGMLHISVTQREPVVRFQGASDGLYADAGGFLFPLQSRFTARVPVIDGALPLQMGKGFKGEPGTDAEKEWVTSVLGLVRYLGARKEWAGLIGQITVLRGGDFVLIPREGNERFLFGPPTDLDAKFSRIRRYYESVAPLEAGYRTVDVRYRDQLVCKR